MEELYQQRMLVFIENEPQSNEYEQLIFTQKQYKELTNFISKLYGIEGITMDGLEVIDMKSSEETYTLPDLRNHS